jgi:hypothetical protein
MKLFRASRRGESVSHLAEKGSLQINMLEQIPIAKVFNPGSGPGQAFGGICSAA